MKNIPQQLKLSISIFKEGNSFIAYLPSLDLSTSGKTFQEVKQRTKEIVEIFFEGIADIKHTLLTHSLQTQIIPPTSPQSITPKYKDHK